MHKQATSDYDVVRMQHDLVAKGWLPIDLARKAGVSHMSVSRFFTGERRTARMAKKLAQALGYSIRRYLDPPSSPNDGSSNEGAEVSR